MRTITITTHEGPKQAQGFIPRGSTHLAVTRAEYMTGPESWTVTHIPTGMSCTGHNHFSRSRARDFCLRILAEQPWLDVAELDPQNLPKDASAGMLSLIQSFVYGGAR